jgi:acyl-CoA reductase-like NAD-dependent aldehyde dehydrogenase
MELSPLLDAALAYRAPDLAARQGQLNALADALEAEAERIARTITAATAKPIALSRGEVARGVGLLRATAAAARALAPIHRGLDGGGWAEVHREPIGPVLAVTPFNFPLNLALHKIAPALAAGAPLIWKPSPRAPGVAEAARALLDRAGVAAAAVQVANLADDAVAALCLDPRLALMSFTGSAPVGHLLQAKCRRARALLELGGNAAVILHRVADRAETARRVARAACAQAGQVCISVQRILYPAEDSWWPAALADAFKAVPCGDPWLEATVCGPVINAEAKARIQGLVEGYRAAGGRILSGASWEGLVMAPTLIAGVDAAHPLVRETEAFAPLATLHPYRGLEQALAIADDTPFGLQAGILTDDVGAVSAAFRRLRVGTLVVGDVPSRRDDRLPYGGVKDSGVGREGADATVLDYTQERVLYAPNP